MAPLTAAQLVAHPEFQTVILDLPPTKKGQVAVATDRGGPIKIAYEIHGTGPVHLVWVMGLGALHWAWQRQTKYFGHDQGTKYSCLVFDNRGIGKSDKPLMRYSSSEMAKDALELLNHVGWTAERQLHVIGVSMGGMIAQEMAYLEPERIASLSLISTAARLVNTIGFIENLRQRINLLSIPKAIDVQLGEIKPRLFSDAWLDAPDQDGHFPSNGDRFASMEVLKRQDPETFPRKGFICQAVAAGWHHKSAAQLKQIGDTVGRERIQVMHGTIDRMITYPHCEVLVEELGGEKLGVKKIVFEGKGHVLFLEERGTFHRLISDLVARNESS